MQTFIRTPNLLTSHLHSAFVVIFDLYREHRRFRPLVVIMSALLYLASFHALHAQALHEQALLAQPINAQEADLHLAREGAISPAEAAIIGGGEAAPNAWPWVVALVRPDIEDNFWAQYCAGTLIAPDWVVTAAHCTFRASQKATPDQIQVLVTPSSLRDEASQRVGIKQIVRHPDFDRPTGDSDVALIQLAQPLDRAYAKVVEFDEMQAVLPDSLATVIGWGRTEKTHRSDRLREVQVPLVSQKVCTTAYTQLNYAITDRMLCAGYSAGGKDACSGDSGGPLVISRDDTNGNQSWAVAGIVSWGKDCAKPNAYGVYTKLSLFIPWMRLKMALAQASTTTILPTPNLNLINGQSFTVYQAFFPYYASTPQK